jgi:phenylpyruvate tautomerase PptA (4-oxalocrotonate tautomerase family)
VPLVRIDLPAGDPPEYGRAIADVVHRALVATMNVPEHDQFTVITEHPATRLVIDPGYLGIERSPAAIIIQVTLNEGRTTEIKGAFYRGVAAGLEESIGLRQDDVVISLVEVRKENWSFGNGIAQYAE